MIKKQKSKLDTPKVEVIKVGKKMSMGAGIKSSHPATKADGTVRDLPCACDNAGSVAIIKGGFRSKK